MAQFSPEQALSEGWILHLSDATHPKSLRIERLDEARAFAQDEDAWEHVVTQALAGSAHHLDALQIIAIANPGEFELIENHAAYLNLIHQLSMIPGWSGQQAA